MYNAILMNIKGIMSLSSFPKALSWVMDRVYMVEPRMRIPRVRNVYYIQTIILHK